MQTQSSDALVFFGITGDLAYKKIFPALYAMARSGYLDIPVIGIARAPWTLDQLKDRVRDSIEQLAEVDTEVLNKLLSLLQYIVGDYSEQQTYTLLGAALQGKTRPLHYLAIPPNMFPAVVSGLSASGCAGNARVVVEKPFGRDLASAQSLNKSLLSVFPESAIFRIDHFLGKEAVQNLLYFRFSNTFLEPIWNRDYVESIHITMAENFGIRGRGKMYEETGCIRDVVQNHLLQVCACLTMDAPESGSAEALRDEKVRLLQAVRPSQTDDVVRGQFIGYRDEKDVAPDSGVETYAALRLFIDNARWAGVPVIIRAGKCLPITCTEVMVKLKPQQREVFPITCTTSSHANHVRFRLGPDVAIALGVRSKIPGEEMCGHAVELLAVKTGGDDQEPYQRLLHDAMLGDAGLFARQDMVEAQWQIVEGIIRQPSPLYPYASNSWGPAEAERLSADIGGWAWSAIGDSL